jgi:hypothetical protein
MCHGPDFECAKNSGHDPFILLITLFIAIDTQLSWHKMDDIIANLNQMLDESYKHRNAENCVCSLCGKSDGLMAFDVMRDSFKIGEELPQDFVPTSLSNGYIRGSYPVCISCAPSCKKCGLPKLSDKILEFCHKRDASIGRGVCNHLQVRLVFVAIFKKMFKLGRFKLNS